MNMLSPFLTLNCSCDEALQWSKQNLMHDGLHVMQTFDLHTARLALEDCSCPQHGTDQCDCQMVVLLVYDGAPEPATLILHGNDGQTWLSIVETPGQRRNVKTTTTIKNALQGKRPVRISDRT